MTAASTRAAAQMKIGIALGVLQRGYRAAADKAVAHAGLSHAMAWPLMTIGRLGGNVRPGVVADTLGIEAPSLARSVEQLVEAGLAERHSDPADGRAKTLHLTPAGQAVWEQIEATLNTLRSELFAGLADEDLAACLRVFDALGERLGCGVPVMPVKPRARRRDDAA
ncbi:MAG TPA: MarR family winged helix-turn-helix transcriptional regulator [Ideonella sp.]|uniref:MarR family winged helix-turn-helix transcriptional regulator n=1 Tax=Ideonella sp. TaxID=1929293 RepID=UPI002C206F74|nr:MarR family winged helix-turn-helix transcriptional regulator [Ideonella sp.]HSI49787.1 MarR family winged helix-turn-helix transcriptional regulator [Ideonella sp.]